jgi:hypothetical protein
MSEITAAELHNALIFSGKEYSALSWNGFNVFGDAKSIAEIKRLIYAKDRLKSLEKFNSQQEADIANGSAYAEDRRHEDAVYVERK